MMEKFAEDDRIEQMNAQKRRMKQLEHKRAVEELIQHRREQHKVSTKEFSVSLCDSSASTRRNSRTASVKRLKLEEERKSSRRKDRNSLRRMRKMFLDICPKASSGKKIILLSIFSTLFLETETISLAWEQRTPMHTLLQLVAISKHSISPTINQVFANHFTRLFFIICLPTSFFFTLKEFIFLFPIYIFTSTNSQNKL